jgi:hypothetical protein
VAESDRFGPYVVYECLGTGGMATVHRASIELEDDATREVALKRLLRSDAATYDELIGDPGDEPSIEIVEDPGQPSARGSARFKDADTVVSVSGLIDRDKRR